MKDFDREDLKKLYIPSPDSHKGQNGKVLIIGGSQLFHAASLWALEIASKIVDMVFYSSVPENNRIMEQEKSEWRNGIVVPRDRLDDYVQEADSILIGPGLPREEGIEVGDDDTKEMTQRLLTAYPDKKWVVDGGSLQVISPEILPKHAIVTPHHLEFSRLFGKEIEGQEGIGGLEQELARKYGVVIVLKGQEDIVCSPDECTKITGGNAGMTKGGTGDVLAGLTAGLYAQNDDAYLVAKVASYINKKAGESLYERVGLYFNASDLVQEIPKVMKEVLRRGVDKL